MLSSIVAASAVTLYNPPNAGNALDAIEAALSKIINNPHLTKEQLKSAKTVSESVEKTVEFLESPEGKKLSEKERGAKVTSAINLLSGLQEQWQKAASQLNSEKKEELEKKLKEKEAELAKDQKMLKVLNLEKKLAEKKLALEKLVEQKNAKDAAASKEQAEKDAAAQQEMVTNLVNMAKNMKAGDKVVDDKAGTIKKVQTNLEGRLKDVTDKLTKLDDEEKKMQAQIKEEVAAPTTGSKDAISKGASMLKMLMKKEKRQFDKTRAVLKGEQKELKEAVSALKTGDVAGLSKVMAKMQGDMKTMQAKSHKFLY